MMQSSAVHINFLVSRSSIFWGIGGIKITGVLRSLFLKKMYLCSTVDAIPGRTSDPFIVWTQKILQKFAMEKSYLHISCACLLV